VRHSHVVIERYSSAMSAVFARRSRSRTFK
jgi:hypothetical protein